MSTNGRNRNPREIEKDLDQTRARMGHTLDALQEKLSLGELFDEALGYFRGSAGGEFAANFKRTVTQNPVPITMVGLGLAWLALSGRRSDRSEIDPSLTGHYGDTEPPGGYPDIPSAYSVAEADAETGMEGFEGAVPSDLTAHPYGGPPGVGSSTSGMTGAAMQGGAPSTSGSSDEVAEDMDETSHSHDKGDDSTRGKARDAAQRARAGAARMAGGGRERMQRLTQGARQGGYRMGAMGRHQAARARSGFEHILHEQPLVLGAIGIALGAALAAGLPGTRREDELMGQVRDEALGRVRDKGQRAATAARDAARGEADREGLTRETASEKLQEGYEKAKRVSAAAGTAAKDEARK